MIVTFYAHTRDARRPLTRALSWPALATTLRRFRPVSGDKRHRLRAAPLWSPVELREPRRASSCVATVCALVLDYDDAAALTLSEALARWEGLERVGYTTWSHRSDAPRCRVVLPLTRPIAGDQWADLYRAILTDQGQGADPQCCDPSRAYYLPAIGAGGPHESAHVAGDWLDLTDRAEQVQADRARRAQQQADSRRRQAERARRQIRERGAQERTLRQVLATDGDARRRVADLAGMTIAQASTGGEIARRGLCPACGRADVWFALAKGFARCNHRQSCGWTGSVYDYALFLR